MKIISFLLLAGLATAKISAQPQESWQWTTDDTPESREPANYGVLSPYDRLFRQYGHRQGVNWCLLAAQAYEESRFNPNARSGAGACGLLQLMPSTAQQLGHPAWMLFRPALNIRLGATYLIEQAKRFPPTITGYDRCCFALAAYNAGYGHIRDARILARQMGLSPDRWRGNVEIALAHLSQPYYAERARYGYCRASETIPYVNQIMARFNRYAKIVGIPPNPFPEYR